mgnify:CR=1 FL=1
MKVTPRQADSFIRKPSPEVRAILVYGPDNGLVHERVAALVATVLDDPADVFRYSELSAASVRSDPATLIDDALAQAFGGGRRVVVIGDAGDALTDMFRSLLDHPGLADPGVALVLARAGDLGGRSSLRRLFEGADNAAAIACYADDAPGLHRLVGAMLAENAVTAKPGVVDVIVDQLGPDRQLNRRELEKLVLFAGNDGVIDVDDVAACIGDSAEAALDDTIMAALDGDYRALERALERAWSEGTSPVALLRAGQRHLQRLHLVGALAGQSGRSIDDAMKALRPPVFWKAAARFRSQANRWQTGNLARALMRLTEAESLVKTTGIPDRSVCARALLAITQMARTSKRA